MDLLQEFPGRGGSLASVLLAPPWLSKICSVEDLSDVERRGCPHKVASPTLDFLCHPAPLLQEIKVSTSSVAALFLKVALTGQRIAMVDMVLLVFFQHFHVYRKGGWSQSFL